jgi:hypothetical protein
MPKLLSAKILIVAALLNPGTNTLGTANPSGSLGTAAGSATDPSTTGTAAVDLSKEA